MSQSRMKSGCRAAMLAGVATLSSCRSQAERELGREVTGMAHLVNQVRDVNNARQRAPALGELRTTACRAAEVCRLQQLCVQAYELEAHALSAADQVASALALGAAEAQAAAPLLTSSERALEAAHSKMLECVNLQGELERRFVAKR